MSDMFLSWPTLVFFITFLILGGIIFFLSVKFSRDIKKCKEVDVTDVILASITIATTMMVSSIAFFTCLFKRCPITIAGSSSPSLTTINIYLGIISILGIILMINGIVVIEKSKKVPEKCKGIKDNLKSFAGIMITMGIIMVLSTISFFIYRMVQVKKKIALLKSFDAQSTNSWQTQQRRPQSQGFNQPPGIGGALADALRGKKRDSDASKHHEIYSQIASENNIQKALEKKERRIAMAKRSAQEKRPPSLVANNQVPSPESTNTRWGNPWGSRKNRLSNNSQKSSSTNLTSAEGLERQLQIRKELEARGIIDQIAAKYKDRKRQSSPPILSGAPLSPPPMLSGNALLPVR